MVLVRRVSLSGISFRNIRYYHPALVSLVGRKVFVKEDAGGLMVYGSPYGPIYRALPNCFSEGTGTARETEQCLRMEGPADFGTRTTFPQPKDGVV